MAISPVSVIKQRNNINFGHYEDDSDRETNYNHSGGYSSKANRYVSTPLIVLMTLNPSLLNSREAHLPNQDANSITIEAPEQMNEPTEVDANTYVYSPELEAEELSDIQSSPKVPEAQQNDLMNSARALANKIIGFNGDTNLTWKSFYQIRHTYGEIMPGVVLGKIASSPDATPKIQKTSAYAYVASNLNDGTKYKAGEWIKKNCSNNANIMDGAYSAAGTIDNIELRKAFKALLIDSPSGVKEAKRHAELIIGLNGNHDLTYFSFCNLRKIARWEMASAALKQISTNPDATPKILRESAYAYVASNPTDQGRYNAGTWIKKYYSKNKYIMEGAYSAASTIENVRLRNSFKALFVNNTSSSSGKSSVKSTKKEVPLKDVPINNVTPKFGGD